MRNRFMNAILAGLAGLAFSPAILAQTAEQSGAARALIATPKEDLSGVWSPRGGDLSTTFATPSRTLYAEPVMRPWAEEIHMRARLGTNRNDPAWDFLDPNQSCFPATPTRIPYLPRPFEIIQIPGKVIILNEWNHEVRHIYMDGREHSRGLKPTFRGHSLGRWDGDTLVIETIGIREEPWLNDQGHPHTDALRFVERYRRLDHETLEMEFTYDDPEAYTKPWGGKRVYELKPDWLIMEQITCEDHLKERLERFIKRTR